MSTRETVAKAILAEVYDGNPDDPAPALCSEDFSAAAAVIAAYESDPPEWLTSLVTLAEAVLDRVGWKRADLALDAVPEPVRRAAGVL